MPADRRDRAGLGHAPRLQDRQAGLARGRPPTAPAARPSRRTGSPAGATCRGPSSSGSTPIQMVGTPAATVTCSSSIRSAIAGGERSGPGITSLAPQATAGVGEAPGVGVEHRHDRQDHVALAGAEAVGDHHAHRVQAGRAVRVDDALGVAGGAARVAHRRGPVLVRVVATRPGRPRPAAPRSRAAARPPSGLGTSPLPSSITTMWRTVSNVSSSGQQQAEQRPVDEDHLVLGVVDDVGELLGEQPDVERVQHPARCTARRSTARGGGPCSRRTWRPGRRRRCPRSSSTPPRRRVRSAHSP